MYKLFRFAGTLLLAAALSFRGVGAILADSNDGKTEPVALILRSNSDVEQDGDDDDDDTPPSTDDDGFDTPLTDYDGIDTPATDNDGVDTPLSTDGDGINTPYTDYDGVDDPGVPTLRASASVGAIELTWNATAAADYFQLWRWEQTNRWAQVGGGNLNATTYRDENIVPGTTYTYTIRAVSEDGETSAWSAYASATAEEPGALTAAPVLSAVAGTSQVDLSWNTIPGASRYELWAWDSENGWEQIGGANLTETSYQHVGVSDGVTYYYAIRAVAGSGSPGPWSQYAEATVGEPSSTSTSTPTSTPTSTATATPTATKENSPPNPPGASLRSTQFTATPTPTATLDLRLLPPDTDNDGTDSDGIDTTDNDGVDTTDNDGIDTTDGDGVDTTDNDGIDTTDGDGVDTTDNDGIDTTDNDGVDTTDNDGIDTTDGDGVYTTDNDGVDRHGDGIDTTDNDGVDTTDNDGIDTTDGDGIVYTTDNDGVDTTDGDGIDPDRQRRHRQRRHRHAHPDRQRRHRQRRHRHTHPDRQRRNRQRRHRHAVAIDAIDAIVAINRIS